MFFFSICLFSVSCHNSRRSKADNRVDCGRIQPFFLFCLLYFCLSLTGSDSFLEEMCLNDWWIYVCFHELYLCIKKTSQCSNGWQIVLRHPLTANLLRSACCWIQSTPEIDDRLVCCDIIINVWWEWLSSFIYKLSFSWVRRIIGWFSRVYVRCALTGMFQWRNLISTIPSLSNLYRFIPSYCVSW